VRPGSQGSHRQTGPQVIWEKKGPSQNNPCGGTICIKEGFVTRGKNSSRCAAPHDADTVHLENSMESRRDYKNAGKASFRKSVRRSQTRFANRGMAIGHRRSSHEGGGERMPYTTGGRKGCGVGEGSQGKTIMRQSPSWGSGLPQGGMSGGLSRKG